MRLAALVVVLALVAYQAYAPIPDAEAFALSDMCLRCRPSDWTIGVGPSNVNCTDFSKVSGNGPYRVCDNGNFPGISCNAGNTNVNSITIDLKGVTCLTPLIGDFPQIQVMSITQNAITSLPLNFSKLAALTALYASQNQINSVPSFGNMVNLARLAIDRNLLTDWPAGMASLGKVTTLDVSGNAIATAIPTAIGSMTALRQLIIKNNKITGNLPNELSLLTLLNDFDFSNNSITGSLPSGIGSMTALTRFYGTANWIVSTIPASLSALTGLNTQTGFGGQFVMGPPNRLCGCWPNGTITPVGCLLTNSSFCASNPAPFSCGAGVPRQDCTSCTDPVGCNLPPVGIPTVANSFPTAIFQPTSRPAPTPTGVAPTASIAAAAAVLAAALAL